MHAPHAHKDAHSNLQKSSQKQKLFLLTPLINDKRTQFVSQSENPARRLTMHKGTQKISAEQRYTYVQYMLCAIIFISHKCNLHIRLDLKIVLWLRPAMRRLWVDMKEEKMRGRQTARVRLLCSLSTSLLAALSLSLSRHLYTCKTKIN